MGRLISAGHIKVDQARAPKTSGRRLTNTKSGIPSIEWRCSMSSTQLVVMAIVLIILVACALGAWTVLRRRSLRHQFGSEYDRVIKESDSRLAGEHELRDRQRRHSALQLRELSPQSREQYAAKWRELQAQFIDSPQDAVNEADDLVTRLIEELGYSPGNYAEQVAQLSVDHADTLKSYREAHEISLSNRRGEAT
ncbi:MAG TPA: hypothetical protein VFC19_00295, partial [Candidatus Limnocylindrales bacterium]|nr:hypothetical protein [Candidatus Limnocylindrales bacterium]